MPLVTAAQVRTAALPEVGGTGLDSGLIEPLITRADRVLASWCHYPAPNSSATRTLETAAYTVYLTGSKQDRRRLCLPWDAGRVNSVTSIYDDPLRDWGSDTLVASSDYTLLASEGAVLLSSGSAQGVWTNEVEGSIKATLSVGWADTAAPDDVKQAAILLVQHWMRLRTEAGHESISSGGGGSVTTRPDSIPGSVAELMAPYRLLVVGALP